MYFSYFRLSSTLPKISSTFSRVNKLMSTNSTLSKSDENSFYYVRVIQNPTCRWSTYDSLRLGEKPRKDYPATVKEMAWSSPIWIKNN